jgi:hypothetical protein
VCRNSWLIDVVKDQDGFVMGEPEREQAYFYWRNWNMPK